MTGPQLWEHQPEWELGTVVCVTVLDLIGKDGLPSTKIMNKNDDENKNDDVEGNIKLATDPRTKIPALYRVLMMNDDYTPMEFVIEVLEKFFQKNREEATQIMLHVHQRGVGVCGVYAYDLAETKAMQVMNYARKYEHPLQVQLEKE